MLKDQLLEEAKTIDASVELDGIFESVELSENVKEKFTLVFESAVKKQALQLAESHILAIAEKAEKEVEEKVEKETEEAEKRFVETADKFFSHIAAEWLKENQVAVDKGIKADLFESMFESLKTVFVEHNVVLPEESVDVVAEMEEELAEAKQETSTIFEQKVALTEELNSLKREHAIKEATSNLTESQKEKVESLIEGLDYSEKFESKLSAIVEMATSKTAVVEKQLSENTVVDVEIEGLNYVVEAVKDQKPTSTNSNMSSYVNSAKRI